MHAFLTAWLLALCFERKYCNFRKVSTKHQLVNAINPSKVYFTTLMLWYYSFLYRIVWFAMSHVISISIHISTEYFYFLSYPSSLQLTANNIIFANMTRQNRAERSFWNIPSYYATYYIERKPCSLFYSKTNMIRLWIWHFAVCTLPPPRTKYSIRLLHFFLYTQKIKASVQTF